MTLITYLLACIHEACHWAAMRAEGLEARITLSRRLYFLVFETDLSQLWSLPRCRRYSPLIAGMAFDAVVLCGALVARLGAAEGWWHLAPGAARLLAALALVELSALAAQFYVFLRTDIYAVLITATGCVHLWRVNQLRLRGAVRRLSPEQRCELDAAHPRDLGVARWYTWVYLIGLVWAACFFLLYFLPATVRLVSWLAGTIGAARVTTLAFWEALVFALVVLSPQALTGAVALRDLRRRRAHRRDGHSPQLPRS